MKQKDTLLLAIHKEIRLTTDYLPTKKLDTIYFGGGTPSILQGDEIKRIFEELSKYYEWSSDCEITLEANPDDLDIGKLRELKDAGINRLSIGTQSFFEDDLKYMNRSHNALQAKECIANSLDIGITEISIDLIFGCPTSNPDKWTENLEIFAAYNLPHVSCYALTVEPKTALEKHIRSGKSAAVSEEQQEKEFLITMDFLKDQGYEHYEISNYAKDQKYAKHNTAYWQNEAYLGIGPSAHSFNGNSRKWNIANNALYTKSLENDELNSQLEILGESEKYNELIMTSLRTQWGLSVKSISLLENKFKDHVHQNIDLLINKKLIFKKDDVYQLTIAGKLIADNVCSDLFFVD